MSHITNLGRIIYGKERPSYCICDRCGTDNLKFGGASKDYDASLFEGHFRYTESETVEKL